MVSDYNSKKLADRIFPEENGEEVDILSIPPEKRRLHTETYDFTISTIIEYLESGHIVVPQFQRSYVWNRALASRLIESLIIQCPIPVIYLHQNADESLSVIDGNQRLNSVRLFVEDGFQLKGLTAYPELSGLYFSQLDPRFQRHIRNRTLRCIVILKDTHPQIKYDVFERLNTGSVQLNPQELRHGLNYGKLLSEIESLAREKTWQFLTGIQRDTRMKGSELILRFFGMAKSLDSYSKPLSGFLTSFCEENKNPSDGVLKTWSREFQQTIESVKHVYGDSAFRVFGNKTSRNLSINAALYDAQMVGFYKIGPKIRPISDRRREEIRENTIRLFEDEKFSNAISSGTSQKRLVLYRIDAFERFLLSQGLVREV